MEYTQSTPHLDITRILKSYNLRYEIEVSAEVAEKEGHCRYEHSEWRHEGL